jgi:hypothetical protein
VPPVTKASSPSPRSRAAFEEPAALARLNKSLESAQDALTELRKHTERDVSEGARDLYKDVRTFVSSARRDTSKLAKALQRDFERAQKQLANASASATDRSATATSTRTSASRPTAKSARSKTEPRGGVSERAHLDRPRTDAP